MIRDPKFATEDTGIMVAQENCIHHRGCAIRGGFQQIWRRALTVDATPIGVAATMLPTCVASPTKQTNAVRTITSNIIETGIWSKSAPQNPFVIQHSAFFHWRRAPHRGLQMTHHARRNSTKSLYSLKCSWFGPCLAKIGEMRCTAAILCTAYFVSSSIRAARLGNFHGNSRGGKR